MIILATLKDHKVAGQRRAAGRMIRKMVVIAVDNYNIMIAEGSSPSLLVGKKFFGNLIHLKRSLEELGLDEDYARKQIAVFFQKHFGESASDLTWFEMNEHFKVSKRCSDSSGKLQLYCDLKAKGWQEIGK